MFKYNLCPLKNKNIKKYKKKRKRAFLGMHSGGKKKKMDERLEYILSQKKI